MAIESILVPDIGSASQVAVIEVSIKVGDQITVDQPLITLEGDKATMEVPSTVAGIVESVEIKVGDKVSTGSVIAKIKVDGDTATNKPAAEKPAVQQPAPAASAPAAPRPQPQSTAPEVLNEEIHAGPSARRLAREVGIDLKRIKGSGEKGRITKQDVQQYIQNKLQLAEQGGGAGLNFPPLPVIDFSKFGETEITQLSKIKKISGANLARNWATIPHVTQFGEADVTELEMFRQQQKVLADAQNIRLTPLVFIMKAVVAALKKFPNFNASLSNDGQELILKKYFHLGVAVDTPNGLVVPVIRDVDQKGVFEIAKELGVISAKAREKGLSMTDMQGGCFSISSLGGIGGTAFTPIINAPEVAILGVSKVQKKPVYIEDQFEPRLMLPLSLSYDHRVIDGAEGARFIAYLSESLSDIRTLLL